mmetsp:Transcript_8116/g.23149  ORF Transcript_8116/g.23149 Transcript_8116/m.23149 type:complete len:115 (-) Transcript_8116:220-564(-)
MSLLNVLLPLVCFFLITVIAVVWTWRQTRKARPVPKPVVDRAAVERTFPKQDDIASGECTVCLEGLEAGQGCRLLHCAHAFHAECIDEWFLHGGSAMVCPSCRRRHEVAPKIEV